MGGNIADFGFGFGFGSELLAHRLDFGIHS